MSPVVCGDCLTPDDDCDERGIDGAGGRLVVRNNRVDYSDMMVLSTIGE